MELNVTSMEFINALNNTYIVCFSILAILCFACIIGICTIKKKKIYDLVFDMGVFWLFIFFVFNIVMSFSYYLILS
jgi:hypothetical protein